MENKSPIVGVCLSVEDFGLGKRERIEWESACRSNERDLREGFARGRGRGRVE